MRIRCMLLFAMFLLLTGCWNRVELNEIAIISATGIDWRDGKWVLSYQIIIPKTISDATGGGSGAASINVFSTTGDSLRMATSKASQETSRELYFSHNQVVIISQEAARKGMESLLESYLRNHDARETVSVFLSKGSARRMLEQLIPLEQVPGSAIQRMIVNEETGSGSFRKVMIHNVLKELLGSTKATSIPGLTLAGSKESTDSTEKIGKTSTPSKVRLSELGLIHGDKLVGWLSDEQSKGVMWLTNNIDKMTVSFGCPDENSGRESSAVKILKTATTLKPVPINDRWKMEVKVKAQGTLVQYNCAGDLTKPNEMEKIERQIESEIEAIMLGGWESVRKYKADVLGFGTKVHEQHPKLWKRASESWDELFPQTEIDIKVHMNVDSAGMSGRNFKDAQERSGP